MHLAGAARQMTFLEAVANADAAAAAAITVARGQWHAPRCPLTPLPFPTACVVVASSSVAIAIALANVAKKQLAKFSTDRQTDRRGERGETGAGYGSKAAAS